MDIMSGVPSMLLTLVNDEELTVHIPGMEKLETDDGPCVILQMPGLPVPKGEYQAVAHNTVVEDDTMLMSYKTSKETYLAAVKLPENVDPVGRMNGLISKGMVKLTFPYLKNTDFVHTPVKIVRPTPYCDAFDRSDLGRKLCEVIAHSVVKSKSFTAYKTVGSMTFMVLREVYGGDVITIYNSGIAYRDMKFKQKVSDPTCFSYCVCDSPIWKFGFLNGDQSSILTSNTLGDIGGLTKKDQDLCDLQFDPEGVRVLPPVGLRAGGVFPELEINWRRLRASYGWLTS
ncbi:uncharacterized protein LOC143617006 [Bidens hawaiensis]|uniref:uncharacterized protein LOC143617006 n=1 Tax=Bidens hawaiensis TaxID=980011 RepID=UPI0040494CFC